MPEEISKIELEPIELEPIVLVEPNYKVTDISISVLNNYLEITMTLNADSESEKDVFAPPRIVKALYPKSSTMFNVNYGMVTSPKGSIWGVTSITILSGMGRTCVIQHSLIEASRVSDAVAREPFTLESLETYLSKNTGA